MKNNSTTANVCRYGLWILLPLIFASLHVISSYGQCTTPPAPLTCPVAGSIVLTEGSSVNSGNTYTATGTTSLNSITMNGGTLVVCGTLNLANLTYTSGTIYVAPGGTLNYTNSGTALVLGSNSSIYNFGTIYSAGSIVTGSNNTIMNCTLSSLFTIPFNQFVIQGPNTQFINNGTFNSSYFIVQSNNSANVVCSGPGSAISTGIMINQLANAFNSPSGSSCIQITNTIINSQPMTATGNVFICYNSGSVSVIGSANFGNATVSNPCASCSIPLPIGLISANAACDNMNIHVSWVAEPDPTCIGYTIQRSSNGMQFTDALFVNCQSGNATTPQEYSVQLSPASNTQEEFLRLKQTDSDGGEVLSDILQVDCSYGLTIDIFPTLVTTPYVTVRSDEPIESIILYSMDGKKVQIFDVQDEKEVVIEIDTRMAIGQYLLTVETRSHRADKLLRIIR